MTWRDPHEIDNLAARPEYQADLNRLRKVLETWIDQSGDQGRIPEAPDLIRQQGVTRPASPPNTGYALPGHGP